MSKDTILDGLTAILIPFFEYFENNLTIYLLL